MKLPDTFQVGPYTLKLSRDSRLLNANDIGACRMSTGELVVRDGLTPQETVLTLLHEFCHVYGALWDGEVDERQANRLSGFLYAILRDNPGLQALVARAERETSE